MNDIFSARIIIKIYRREEAGTVWTSVAETLAGFLRAKLRALLYRGIALERGKPGRLAFVVYQLEDFICKSIRIDRSIGLFFCFLFPLATSSLSVMKICTQ